MDISLGKYLKVKKRSQNELSEKEIFCELIDYYERLALRNETLYKEYGIDFNEYDEDFFIVIENLFYLKYGEWKTQIITWYIWERKNLETGEVGKLELTNDINDSVEEFIIDSSIDLWNILKKIEKNLKQND